MNTLSNRFTVNDHRVLGVLGIFEPCGSAHRSHIARTEPRKRSIKTKHRSKFAQYYAVFRRTCHHIEEVVGSNKIGHLRGTCNMPLANVGSVVLHQILFLTHMVYMNLAFAQAEPSLVVLLYFVSKLLARRPEDLEPAIWPPAPMPKF